MFAIGLYNFIWELLNFKSFLIIVDILILSSLTITLHADTRIPGYNYFQSSSINNDTNYKTFWSYLGSSLNRQDINRFNNWHAKAKFKDISPKFCAAYFFKAPWPNQIEVDSEGSLVFVRNPNDKESHTMIELSVNNQPGLGDFVNYGGYRSMAIGTPYEINIDTKVVNGDWIKTIPWLVVFQGHAIPDLFDKGKKFNPPFALVISRGRWEAHVRADSRLSLPDDRKYQRFDKIDLGKVTPEKWTRFKIKVIWGSTNYPKNNDTALAIWRDDKLFHQEWGKHNFYNNRTLLGDNLGPYLMIGAYTPSFSNEHSPITLKIRELTIKKAVR